jgi:hypothetical protein
MEEPELEPTAAAMPAEAEIAEQDAAAEADDVADVADDEKDES